MISIIGSGRWRLLCALIANGFGQAWAAVGLALLVERSFSKLGSGNPGVVSILGLVGAFAVIVVAGSWLRARERIDAERLGQGYVHDVRLQMFDHLVSMSPRTVGDRSTGSTALRFVGDLSAVRRWVSLGLGRLVVAVTMIVATLTALWSVEPLLALVTAGAATMGLGGAVLVGPGLRAADRNARRHRSGLAGRVTELINAVGVVQANGAVPRERRRVARRSEAVRDAMVDRAEHLGRLGAVAEGTGSLAIAVLLIGALVAGLDGPAVAAGMTVVGTLVPHLRGLARIQEYRQGAVVATEAIERFLARPTRAASTGDHRALPPGAGQLDLFGLGSGTALVDVTASASPGTTVAIVGPNGAGKSTLFALIAGLLDPDTGRVTLDGVTPGSLHPSDLRRTIGVAGPDFPLLRGTVRRNLTYRAPDATPEELADLLERCDLTDVVDGLPDGLDTRVVEGGVNLSAGQRQRLQLARAVLGQPRLLLLDEADANLDHRTVQVMERLLAERTGTTLLITHDQRRLAAADVVWCLDRGRLVEVGRPDQLLRADGPTAHLFTPLAHSSASTEIAPGPETLVDAG